MTRCFLAAAFVLISSICLAQTPAGDGGGIFAPIPAVTGPTPHLAGGTVDLSGVWMGSGANSGDISRGLKAGSEFAILPWAAEVTKKRLSQDDPEALCLPFGIPRGAPYPWRLVQTPTHYFILYEGNIHSFRQIFMDGRGHLPAADLDPTWYGHSIGRWDGETLVIDTVGFNDKFWFDYLGHPHTEQLHTIERLTRSDKGNITMEVTIEDPGAYAKPFTTVGRARLMPAGEELIEYICQENNQATGHLNGPAVLPTEGLVPKTR